MRIPGAARAMPERGADEPGARQPPGPETVTIRGARSPIVRAAPHPARLAFQPRCRSVDGRVGGLDDVGAHQRIRQRVQHRHRLRGAEGEIKARYPVAPRAQLLTVGCQSGARSQPGEHRLQVLGAYLAGHSERRHRRPHPAARRLTRPRVIVVEAAGDLPQVVVLLTDAQLPQRQHHPPIDPVRLVSLEETFAIAPNAADAGAHPWCTCALVRIASRRRRKCAGF